MIVDLCANLLGALVCSWVRVCVDLGIDTDTHVSHSDSGLALRVCAYVGSILLHSLVAAASDLN